MTLDKLRFKNKSSPTRADAAPKVVIEGKTKPNAEVVIENRSLAPFAPTGTEDAFTRTKAGADGAFSVELPAAREGDRLKVQAGGSAVSVRLSNVEAIDGRPPVVRQQGVRLVDDGAGAYRFTHVSKSKVFGEPGQIVQMKNARTQEASTFTLDDDGHLPKDARLKGSPGDTWQLTTTDGVHDTELTKGCGQLCAPLPPGTEPAALQKSGTLWDFKGRRLFAGDPKPGTVKQGQIGDCWLVAGVDAVLARKDGPKIIKDMIKENRDGTFTVTFKRYDHDEQRYVDEPITVTSMLWSRPSGALMYGQATSEDLWFPILEKAYAQWKGGYAGVRSGYPFEAFEAIVGAEGRHFDLDVSKADALWQTLETRARQGEAMVAWTRVDTPALGFANTGLTGDHAYMVYGPVLIGPGRVDDDRMIKVRNPWGNNGWSVASSPLQMKDLGNGELLIKLDVFMKYFAGLGAAPT